MNFQMDVTNDYDKIQYLLRGLSMLFCLFNKYFPKQIFLSLCEGQIPFRMLKTEQWIRQIWSLPTGGSCMAGGEKQKINKTIQT